MANTLSLQIYRDGKLNYRWRVMKRGKVLADGGQGYSKRIDCINGAEKVMGFGEITWLSESQDAKYGQTKRVYPDDSADVVDVTYFKNWIEDVEN